mgnify:CR=1 FL=1
MTNATLEEKTILAHHDKVEICKDSHVQFVQVAPATDGKATNVYCPLCNVQYTLNRAETKQYRKQV